MNKTKSKIYIDEPITYMGYAVVRVIDKTYVVPGWHPVPNGTTREDVEFPPNIIIEKKKAAVGEPGVSTGEVDVMVDSSNGKSQYNVTYRNGVWGCTCPASNFRRGDCKHIKGLKQ